MSTVSGRFAQGYRASGQVVTTPEPDGGRTAAYVLGHGTGGHEAAGAPPIKVVQGVQGNRVPRRSPRPLVDSQDSFPPIPPLRELRALHRKDFGPSVSERQARCGLFLAPTRLLEYYGVGQDGLYATGIEVCGSWSGCPVCADRICRERGQEIQQAIDRHRDAGGELYLLTVTIPHHAGHSLSMVRTALNESFRRLKAGAPWKRWAARIALVGTIRGTDSTHGPNGWHPHIHCLLFVEKPIPEEVFPGFVEFLRDRWSDIVSRWVLDDEYRLVYSPGLDRSFWAFGPVNREHGVELRRGDHAGSYVAKMGLGKETATMTIKWAAGGHRTPLQILVDYYYHRRESDGRLWLEWCKTMKGHVHVYWSPGLRKRLLGGAASSDDEVAAEPGEVESDPYLFAVEPTLCQKLLDASGWTFEDLEREIAGAYKTWGLLQLAPLLTGLLPPGEGMVEFDPLDRVFWWRRREPANGWRWGLGPGLTPRLSARARRWLERERVAAACSSALSPERLGNSTACSSASSGSIPDLFGDVGAGCGHTDASAPGDNVAKASLTRVFGHVRGL